MNHPLSLLPDHQPCYRQGLFEFPVHHMRGGTSTGLLIWEGFAPPTQTLREELLRHLMGVPLEGTCEANRQITGLGRGSPTSNKVFLARAACHDGQVHLVSTLAQLAAKTSAIDWSVNCGNMSAALPLWAIDSGLVPVSRQPGLWEIDIHNSNTGVVTTARLRFSPSGQLTCAQIPGVDGHFPSVDLALHQPVGAKTGKLLPTGQPCDRVEGYHLSCVDVAVPMVLLQASDFGKTAQESPAELEADAEFMSALRHIWVTAGLRMGLKNRTGHLMNAKELTRSETIPKVAILGPAQAGGHLAVRYFTPQNAHPSLAVSGGCCLAAAIMIPGTIAHEMAAGVPQATSRWQEFEIQLENPAGILEATVRARQTVSGLEVAQVAYRRTAQILLRGHTPLYQASPGLQAFLRTLCPA